MSHSQTSKQSIKATEEGQIAIAIDTQKTKLLCWKKLEIMSSQDNDSMHRKTRKAIENKQSSLAFFSAPLSRQRDVMKSKCY